MTIASDAAAAAIIDLYERLSHRYIADRSNAGWDERAWLDRFLGLVEAPRRVLDLGCGAGAPIAKYLLDSGCAVTGVDSSPTLIAHCRQHLSAGKWVSRDMRQLDLGETFDGLLAWDSLFHLAPDDQREMFDVFQRHAAAAAVLMFTSGPKAGVAIGNYHGEPLYHASLDPAAYESLLITHHFQVVAHRAEDPNCGGHTIWLARRRHIPRPALSALIA